MGAWQALVAIAGLFGLSSGRGLSYKCYTIQNKCGTDVYVAYGFTRSKDKWQTRAWWKVGGGGEKKTCLIRGRALYAYFDFDGGKTGQYMSDLTMELADPAEFCLDQNKTEITEVTSGTVHTFTNDLTGVSSTTCAGLGIGATMRFFTVIDDGNYNAVKIPKTACPSSFRDSNAPAALVLEKSYEPVNPNSTDLERFINDTHPFAVFGYDPEKGWSVEEARKGLESSEEPLLP